MNTPSIDSPAQRHFNWVVSNGSKWCGRLVSPLNAPFLSSAAVIELAARVKYIIAAAIAAVLLLYQFASRTSQQRSSSTLTPSAGAGGVNPSSSTPPSLTGASSIGSTGGIETLSGDCGSDAKAIDEYFFNVIMQDLSLIRAKEGIAFVKKIHEYKVRYSTDPASFKAMQMVLAVESNFKALSALKGAIFFKTNAMLGRIDDANVLRLSPDGNCLFHALGHGLHLLEDTLKTAGVWRNFPTDHLAIRIEVTRWIKENVAKDKRLRAEIDSAIIEYCPILEEQQTLDFLSIKAARATSDVTELERACQEKAKQLAVLKTVTVEKPGTPEAHKLYIEMTSGEGKFASGPHMYAFCKLNPAIGIRISRKVIFPGRDGTQPREAMSNDFNPPFNAGARFIINPVFNLAADHFDLLVQTATIPK